MSEKVFVFVPAYNVELYIGEAIESIQAQTYTNWSLLILDDCSVDATFQIANRYALTDKRITCIKNDHNLGMLGNWNKGITYCKAKYFFKLDGDDKVHPEMIQTSIDIMKSDIDENIGVVFSKYVNIDSQGNVIVNSEVDLPDFARNKSFSCVPLVLEGESKMLSYSILRQGLSLIRTKVFNMVGGYRYLLSEKTQASTDTEFYFRVGCHYKIFCIDKILYYYRVHQHSISALNTADGLSALKIYEVKTKIIDYYYSQRKISRSFWKKNQQQITFNFLIFLNYKARVDKHIGRVLALSMKLLMLYPLKTVSFYRKRITSINPQH